MELRPRHPHRCLRGPAALHRPGVDHLSGDARVWIPVHRLEVDTFLGGAYLEFDMRLTAGSVVWSESVLASCAEMPTPVEASA